MGGALNDESHFHFVLDREGETWRKETEDTEEEDSAQSASDECRLFYRLQFVTVFFYDEPGPCFTVLTVM